MSGETTSLANAQSAILQQLAELGVRPTGVAEDSRQVRPGDLFIAYRGDFFDGRHYIADAVTRGASAVLWESGDDFVWNSAWRIANLSNYQHHT